MKLQILNPESYAENKPDLLKRITAQAQAPLTDAAAVNATRYATGNAIKSAGLTTGFWSGWRTRFNRVGQDYARDHWIDSACVGETGARVHIPGGFVPLQIKTTGRGTRQVVRTDRYGFPRSAAGLCKRVQDFQTGDGVRLEQPNGQCTGTPAGRLAGIRRTEQLDIKAQAGRITALYQRLTLLLEYH